jgi:hypothetical protein
MKKIIKPYPMTDRLIVRRGYNTRIFFCTRIRVLLSPSSNDPNFWLESPNSLISIFIDLLNVTLRVVFQPIYPIFPNFTLASLGTTVDSDPPFLAVVRY